ncbi:oxidoreductase domain-containing protein [Flammeovirgaceae bacterium 311]|nr:oxidoreductase domain-containing protein [Flammeovirgaceae bacterium 311]
MEEIRWGIIGCGDVAERKSGPAFRQALNSRLVAVMRRDAEKAADFAARHGVPKWYNQADALIHDPEINAIYVATPPSSHEAYANAALAVGKHVYLEKPMALNSEGAGRIEEKAKDSSGKLVIAHYRRELPLFKKVKELLESNEIGKPLFADLLLLQPPKSGVVAATETNWRINPAVSGGGLFHDLAPHQLDLMLHYFGAVGEATGYAANQLKTSEADDFVSGLIHFRNGIHFRGLWSFAAPEAAAADRCDIIGTQGKISFSFFGEAKVVLWQNGQEQSFSFNNPTYIQQPMIEKAVGYFLGRHENPCPASEAVEVMRLIDAFTEKKQY